MARVHIKITAQYNYARDFEGWYLEASVKSKWGRQSRCSRSSLEDIARDVLNTVARSHVKKPKYKIELWEGLHPLSKCEEPCHHWEHTQIPQDEVLESLEGYLADTNLIATAEREARYYEEAIRDDF